jgi:hypothetical protein
MITTYLYEFSLILLGSGGSMLFSVFRNESVQQRYGIGFIMLIVSFILFMTTA